MAARKPNKLTTVIHWKNELSSFNKARKEARAFKHELANIGKSSGLKQIDNDTKRYTRSTTKADREAIAFRKTQNVLDKDLNLTGKQTTQLKRKLDNLNSQFKKGKLDTAAYNHEIQRTTRFYSKLSTEANKAARAEMKNAAAQVKAQEKIAAAKSRAKNNLRAGAAGVGIGVLTGAGFALNNSITRLNDLSNAFTKSQMQSFSDFQNLAGAATVQGLDADKIGDIGKDISDKIGDFLANNAGEAKDLIQLLQKNGVTRKDLEQADTTKLLMLIQDTFDKFNTSQKEQIFYLESIANDGSLLQPVMKNLANTTKLRTRYGLNLSEDDIRKGKDAATARNLIGESINRLFDKFLIGLTSSDTAVNGLLINMKSLQSVALGAGQGVGDWVKYIVDNTSAMFTLMKGIATFDSETIKQGAENWWNSLFIIRNAFSAVGDWLKDLASKVSDWVGNKVDTAKTWISDTTQSIQSNPLWQDSCHC